MITLAIDKATKTPYLVFRGTGTPPSELNFMFKPDLDLWARVYDPQVMGKILRYNLPCDGKLQEYHEAKMIEISPARIFEDTFRYEMLKPYQREGIAAAVQAGNFLIADEMGLGKAQPLTSFILTPTGWRRMGDIRVGDKVIGADGFPTKVLGVYPQGVKDVYKIMFSDGCATECCGDHLWRVTTALKKWRGGRGELLSASELIGNLKTTVINSSGKYNNKYYIPLVDPIRFEREDSLPMDPYLLGLLLGDGGLTNSVVISLADQELIDSVESILPPGHYMKRRKHGGCDYQLSGPDRKEGSNLIRTALKKLGLFGKRSEQKYVPYIYKFSSIPNRIAILQGLLDTDGSVGKKGGAIEYSSTSLRLAMDVQFIVQSLGGVAKITEKPTRCQLAYRVRISLPNNIEPFRLSRKAERVVKRKKYFPTRAIVSIEPFGRKPTQCIRVEAADGLYLTDNCIVTHNTPQAIGIVSKLQARSLVICPTSLKHEWAAQITKFTEANSQIIEGSARDRASLWKAGLDCQFTIASYDILKNPNDLVGANDICNVGMIIFDEITRVKNSKTARAKAIAKLKARRILGLTGTPIENNLEEFYAILKLISPGLFPSFTVFADQYLIRKKMYVGSHSFLKTVGYKNLDLLKAQIAPYMIRRQRNEVLELPPSSTVIREVALSPFQKDIENLLFKCAKDNPDMVLRFFTFGLENMISPVLVPRDWSPDPDFEYEVELLEALLLLEDEGKDEAYTPRLEELALLLEDTDPYKVILFSKYLKALELANNTLGLKMNWLTGKSNVQNELKAWNNPSGPRLLAMTTAGAMGHNLQKNCNIMILMDQLFNPRLTDQLMARIYRMGQDKPVTYYVMDSNSVIEGKVKAIISNKDWLSKNVLEGAAAIAEKIHNGQLAAAVMFGGDYDDED